MHPSANEKLKRRRHSRRRIAIFGALLGVVAVKSHYEKTFVKNKQHNSSLSGLQWVMELLHGHSSQMKNNLGMHKHIFRKLIQILEANGALTTTHYLSLEEQLAIFLYIIVTNASIRKAAERFQRSGDTISKYFHRVIKALTTPSIYNTFIHLPKPIDAVADELVQNPKFYPFLKDCQGAIDGTHIAVSPPASERARYRNRKGQVSQNVLAACTFDLRFCYVLAGWEGSASDSAIYLDARKHDLHLGENKYFLGDAGFPLCQGLLVPFRGVRYHLREWEKANKRPQNYKELVNLRHSQARNVVERIFGIVKKRFRMMRETNEFPIEIQSRLVYAICVLHNFIRIYDPDDLLEIDEEGSNSVGTDHSDDQHRIIDITTHETSMATALRENIAQSMWTQYQVYLSKR